MYRTRIWRAFFILLSLMILAGCQSISANTNPNSSAMPDDPLIGTYWKLMSIDAEPVTVVDGQREPYFVLQRHEQKVHGNGGCNAFSGQYSTDDGHLRLSGIVSTRMFCADGMASEKAFLDLLQRRLQPQIDGNQLMLLGDDGQTRARFESRVLQ